MASLRGRRRSWRERRAQGLLALTLALLVVAVYVVVVVGGGAAVGDTSSPHVGLSVLATAIVALLFEPAWARLEPVMNRLVHGNRSSPYDVLSRFSDSVTASYAADELPQRMAHVLAEGTGAGWSQVWIVVQGRLTLAATWPAGQVAAADQHPPGPAERPGRRAVEVRHAGELLGVLRLREDDRRPLTPVEERLVTSLAAQAGLVLHGATLRAELAQRLEELSRRAEELRCSRERLVEAQDRERRRLERDIHDGAQQHLVALAVNLRLAQTLVVRSPERAGPVLDQQAEAARDTIDILLQMSRGIFPRTLTDQGIAAALCAAVATSPVPVAVTADEVGRYPAAVEAAVYFCCLEAVQNAVKHAAATRIEVHLAAKDEHHLWFSVADDGAGYEPTALGAGAGLANMRDRVDAVGGRIDLSSVPGRGTTITAEVPAGRVPQPRAG